MRKILAFIVIVPLFFACSNKTQEGNNNVIKIGALLPLSGGAAFVGVPLKKGIDLRIKQFNDSNSTKIKVIYEDTKADPKTGKNALLKLHQENVAFVIGPASSGVASTILPDINSYGITTLSPTASKSTLSKPDYFYRNELSDAYGAKKQADYAYDKFNWRRMSVIFVNNEYGVGVKDVFVEEFKKLGGQIVNEFGFVSGTTNFDVIANNVITDSSEAIFIIAEGEYTNIIKNLYEKNNHKVIYATPVFENANNLKILKDAANGVIYTYYGTFGKRLTRKQLNFISSYKLVYGVEPSYYAALGYESADIFVAVLEGNGYKLENINERLSRLVKFNSVTGMLSFDKNGDVLKEVSLKKVINRKFAFIY